MNCAADNPVQAQVDIGAITAFPPDLRVLPATWTLRFREEHVLDEVCVRWSHNKESQSVLHTSGGRPCDSLVTIWTLSEMTADVIMCPRSTPLSGRLYGSPPGGRVAMATRPCADLWSSGPLSSLTRDCTAITRNRQLESQRYVDEGGVCGRLISS